MARTIRHATRVEAALRWPLEAGWKRVARRPISVRFRSGSPLMAITASLCLLIAESILFVLMAVPTCCRRTLVGLKALPEGQLWKCG